jgi:hypothetical protein
MFSVPPNNVVFSIWTTLSFVLSHVGFVENRREQAWRGEENVQHSFELGALGQKRSV